VTRCSGASGVTHVPTARTMCCRAAQAEARPTRYSHWRDHSPSLDVAIEGLGRDGQLRRWTRAPMDARTATLTERGSRSDCSACPVCSIVLRRSSAAVQRLRRPVRREASAVSVKGRMMITSTAWAYIRGGPHQSRESRPVALQKCQRRHRRKPHSHRWRRCGRAVAVNRGRRRVSSRGERCSSLLLFD
jgi:hypothetical protein